MLKKVIKSLTKTESMMSLVINIIQIPAIILGIKWGNFIIISFAALTLLTGIILFLRIAKKTAKRIEKENKKTQLKIENENKTARIKNEIVIQMQNPELLAEYKKSNFYNSFQSLSKKHEFFFLKLSEKFPELTCKELKSTIKSTIK